jgi:hypothetical protein
MITVTNKDVTRFRGDTITESFFVLNNSIPFDIAGCTFKWTLNTLRAPIDIAAQVLQLINVATPATDLIGQINFNLSAVQADLPIGRYFYDVEMTYPNGAIQTIFTGRLNIRQDITK